jgi:hypothetical protein
MYNIPFLDDDGSNFAFWKFCVHMVLDLRDLWGLVDGSVATPADTADTVTKADWTYRDHEARAC